MLFARQNAMCEYVSVSPRWQITAVRLVLGIYQRFAVGIAQYNMQIGNIPIKRRTNMTEIRIHDWVIVGYFSLLRASNDLLVLRSQPLTKIPLL
jgi:hypothetical protein